MNITQRQNILNHIEKIEGLDLYAALARQFPNESDATKIGLGSYNAAEAIQYLQRILSQLKEELQQGLGLLLPASHNFQNDYGSVNLESDLHTIHAWAVNNDISSIATKIESLIYYQIINGFWDKTVVQRSPSQVDYEKHARELTVIEEKLKGYIDQNKGLVDQFTAAVQEVNNFITHKNEEFNTLSSNQQTSTNLLSDIQNILADAKVKQTNINNIIENEGKKLTEIEKRSQVEEASFREYLQTTETHTIELNKLVAETTETLKNATEKLEEFKTLDMYLDAKKTEIEKLAGFAADSSLGHSFNKRKEQLMRSAYIWLGVSIFLMIATGVWLSLVYTSESLRPNTGNIWLDVVLYAVKSAIAFIILGFAVRQYSRERTLQEEYAFKEAVAVTINAYADQLQGEKDEDRRKMIMETIEKMYRQPQIHIEPSNHILGFKRKDVTAVIEKAFEEIKTLSTKGK